MPLSRKIATYLISGKASLSDVVALLTKYNLLTLLPSIKQSVMQLSRDVHKDKTIAIESPYDLSEEAVATIKEIVGEKKAPHTVIINKNVLAGFKAKYKGKLYDGSAERIIRQIIS